MTLCRCVGRLHPRLGLALALLGLAAGAAAAGEPPHTARPEVDGALARLVAGGSDVRVHRSRRTGLARFMAAPHGSGFAVSSPSGVRPEQRAHAFIAEYGAAFGLGDRAETRVLRVSPRDKVGLTHVRVQQMHRGVPVTGAELIVHMDGEDVRVANGRVLDVAEIGDLDVSPTLSEASARDIAANLVRETYAGADPRLATSRLEVFNRGILDRSDAPSRLAWFVEARAAAVREYVWVDAHDGSVLLHFNQRPHALNRTIYDATDSVPGAVVRTEGSSAIGDTDVDLLYAYLADTYNYFKNEHGRNSYDAADAPVVGVAHLPDDNAWWNDVDQRFEFGERYPQADDIVAHEFAHAVTQYTADLLYSFEPGALNEAISDMFGETVDLMNRAGNDEPEVRWLHGEDVPARGATRNLMDPNQYGNPGRVSDPLYYCSARDWYGVHRNSGVPGHAYALMVDGGTYNGRTIRGIGLDKAGHVAYRALSYLTSTSGFEEASDAFQQACTDLVGQQGIVAADCAEVQRALEAVEMPDARPCHSVLLRVRQQGSGSGTITLARTPLEPVQCTPPSSCDAYFAEGNSVTLSASADPGSVFAGWRGDACTDVTSNCEPFLMGDAMEIAAVFEPASTTHPLNVTIGASAPGATVTSSPAGINCGSDCSEPFPAGTVVTLTATASAGYAPTRWGGDCSGVGPACKVVVTGPLSVSVDFGSVPFSVARDFGGSFSGGGAEWGDYDGDGDLDLVALARGSSTLYRNDGGTLVDSGTALVVLAEQMAAAWGDYDNDGDLDLAISGENGTGTHITKIYRNTAGVLADSGMAVPQIGATFSLGWVDYDNDGDLDLVASGDIWDTSGQAWLLRNDGGTLVDSGLALPAASDAEWGDYDGDGDLDLALTGIDNGPSAEAGSLLYRNDGGTLVDTGAALGYSSSTAWIDYDNDGDPDLAFCNSTVALRQNQGGELVHLRSWRTAGWDFAWADADADGDLDMLGVGVTRPTGENATALFLGNAAGQFSEVATGLPDANGAPVAWGDYDNDGRLDLYVHSDNTLYRSSLGASNTPPQPPASTRVVLSADTVRLAWTPGSDARTPSAGLSYNVRVGTTANGSDIVSAMSNVSTGRRLLARIGNAGANRFFVLRNLPPGRYYWAVQSIDSSFAGSAFTATGSFDYPPAVSVAVDVTSDWGTGYCADLTVTNISSSTVNGWQAAFNLPAQQTLTIDSLWNFGYARDGNVVTLQPRWFNRTIWPSQSVTGGFCASGSTGAEYLLTVSQNGTGYGYVSASPAGFECSSDCSQSYPGGTVVTLTATPNAASRFLRWEGACSGTGTCTVTMGPGGASVVAWFVRDTSGGVSVWPVVAQSQPYYNEEDVRISNPTAITALSMTIVIQRTPGLSYNGLFNTVGSQIQQSHTTGATTITYRYTLASGQTISPGNWTFAAQTNGTGTPHPTGGDTYTVTYTVGGQTYTQSGDF